jgi:hypothetical protein
MAELIRKTRLLNHLRLHTYVDMRPSPIHGVGIFAACDIPVGIDPFPTNGSPSGVLIDLTKEEVMLLPPHVRDQIERFILPHSINGIQYYGMPEAGLNSIDVSWFLNSKPSGFANVEILSQISLRDARGLAPLRTVKKVNTGEELFTPYQRTAGIVDDQGRASDTLSRCRICHCPLLPQDGEKIGTGCICRDRFMHLDCAMNWYSRKVQVQLNQGGDDGGSWRMTCTVSCEVCNAPLSKAFTNKLLKSSKGTVVESLGQIMNSAISKDLSITIESAEVTNVDRLVRRNHGSSSGGSKSGENSATRLRRELSALVTRQDVEFVEPLDLTRPRHCMMKFTGALTYKRWPVGTIVRIWMSEDSEWVFGRVVSYCDLSKRNRQAKKRFRHGGFNPTHQRGSYRIEWECTDSPGKSDYDEFSEGDVTVEMVED